MIETAQSLIVDSIEETLLEVRRRYCSGIIAVAYDDENQVIAMQCIAELGHSGYTVVKLPFNNQSQLNNSIALLKEECRFVVGVGSYAVSRGLSVGNRKYAIIATEPCINATLCNYYELSDGCNRVKRHLPECIIYNKNIALSDRQMANAYGNILSYYMLSIDGLLYKCTHHKNKQTQILDEITRFLEGFMQCDEIDAVYITDATINLTGLLGQLDSSESFAVIDIIGETLSCSGNLLLGEGKLMAMYYQFLAVNCLVGMPCGLSLPSNKSDLIHKLSVYTGVQDKVLMQNISIIDSNIIMDYDYVLQEYGDDIRQYLVAMTDILRVGIRHWRRAYFDAGKTVSRFISIREIVEVVRFSNIVTNEYGLYRHYIEMGIC